MQWLYQFREEHLYDATLNAEQVSIHRGIFCNQKFSSIPFSSTKA